MPKQNRVRLNRIFQGLADPTRRAVVERLGRGPAPVGELARSFSMALPSFLQHLKMLEDCGLVRSVKSGRVRTCRLVPQPLALAEGWLEQQRSLWNHRLAQLDTYLNQYKEKP